VVYATAADMEALLGTATYLQAADRDGNGTADADAVTSALEAASSLADTYIAAYLPLATVPTALRNAVIRIAHYDLLGAGGTEEPRKRRDDALAWLDKVATGIATLIVDPAAPESAGAPRMRSSRRLFTREKLAW